MTRSNLHLVAGLLHATDVVDGDGVEALELGDGLRQLQIAFGDEQLGDQAEHLMSPHMRLGGLPFHHFLEQ